MLRALEDFLVPPVNAILPNPVDVQRGPFIVDNPWPLNRRVVVIHARLLRTIPPSPAEEDEGQAFLVQETTWPSDGVTDTFVLPGGVQGQIIEVEAPPGFPSTRGDDFLVEGDTIRFYRVPEAANPGVLARVRGDDAHGYTRRRPCVLELDINVYTRIINQLDSMTSAATQTVLAELTRAPQFTFPQESGVDVLVRLLELRASFSEIERTQVENPAVFRAAIRLQLEGQLDLLVANGTPATTSLIASIEGELEVDPANGEEPVPLPFTIAPEPPEAP